MDRFCELSAAHVMEGASGWIGAHTVNLLADSRDTATLVAGRKSDRVYWHRGGRSVEGSRSPGAGWQSEGVAATRPAGIGRDVVARWEVPRFWTAVIRRKSCRDGLGGI